MNKDITQSKVLSRRNKKLLFLAQAIPIACDLQKNDGLVNQPKSSGSSKIEITGMCRSAEGLNSTRSAGQLVSQVLKCSTLGLEIKVSSALIVESLIWPFIARCSLRTPWFSDKEYGRMILSFRKTAVKIISMESPDNREQSFVKYWINFYNCQVFQDAVRAKREPWNKYPLFGGWLARFVARRVAKRDLSFIYSLQKGSKQMWPQLSFVKMEKDLKLHAKRLSEWHGSCEEDLLNHIRRESVFAFKAGTQGLIPATKFVPTGSSCLQASQREGGALALFERYRLPLKSIEASKIGKLPVLNATLNTWRKENFSIAYAKAINGFAIDPVTVPRSIQYFYRTKKKGQTPHDKFEGLIEPDSHYQESLLYAYSILDTEIDTYSKGKSVQAREKFIKDNMKYGPSVLNVKIIPIAEPSKFRIISVGDGYLYSALQPTQGILLSCWKDHYASTMRFSDLTVKVQELFNTMPDDNYFFLSVDWEASTDLLKKQASLESLRHLMGLPGFDLAWLSMQGGGRAKYPKGAGEGKSKVKFTLPDIELSEGQLMGHPLSFPLLCVINLSVYHCAIERWIDRIFDRRERSRRRSVGLIMWKNVLVNGDDMLLRCERSFITIFYEVAANAGLVPSQGKNNVSYDCCSINSQVFRVIGKTVKRFGYLNLRLVKGTNVKVRFAMEEGNTSTPDQIGKDLSLMIDLCPWSKCSIPTAFRRWKDDWFGDSYHPNWYLPVHLGGFGLDRKHAPENFKITRSQREFAARFVSDPRMALYRRTGMDIPTSDLAGALANWRMVPGDYVQKENESLETKDSWLERLALASRLHHGSSGVKDSVFIRHFRPQYRLKPMSLEGLESYWSAQVFATSLPPCPPLGKLKVLPIFGSDIPYLEE